MKRQLIQSQQVTGRQGSTLVIVIALLGLLSFTGIVFFTFASQERSASENFSEAAKSTTSSSEDVFDWMLEQIIVGPGNRAKGSILYSNTRRHSLTTNMVGSDIHPYTGRGVNVVYEPDPTTGLPGDVPRIDLNFDGTADDEDGTGTEPDTQNLLDFVDSPAANAGREDRVAPSPDVDYTYPDINNLFLAYRGWAIRENPGGGRTQVPIIIPSFFRPQYLKTSNANGRPLVGSPEVPTDADWAHAFNGVNRNTSKFGARSFRPHPQHIAGFAPNGVTPVFRFLTDTEATGVGLARGFPFLPEDATTATGNDPNVRGEMGIWTGSVPTNYELDVDNDGDGISEGIWLDLHFPMQQTNEVAPRNYVVLHSATIYDLNSLIDVNSHANLAGLNRDEMISALTNPANPDNFEHNRLSRSNLGLGPNEVSPLWALRRDRTDGGLPPAANRADYQAKLTALADTAQQFAQNFGDVPDTDLEQANMELMWLLAGRLSYRADGTVDDLHAGRWGDDQWVFNAIHTIGGDAGNYFAADLPRPGRSGNSFETVTSGPRYGGSYTTAGRFGFDDNQDRLEGERDTESGKLRAFGHPMDFAGTGRFTTATTTAYDFASRRFNVTGDAAVADLFQQTSTPVGPSRWIRYNRYSAVRDILNTDPVDRNRYIFGINQDLDNGVADDLLVNPFFDPLLDDPLETVFDIDQARRPFDNIFGPQDVFELQMDNSMLSNAQSEISTRLSSLAPFAFDRASNPGFATDAVRDRFTSYGNTPRFGALRFPDYGDDGVPGLRGTDPIAPSSVRLGNDTTEFAPRWWEFTADTSEVDNDNDGIGDPDGKLEFPPNFGSANGRAYRADDPFRPQLRRLLTVELGQVRQLLGQLPMSINHLLDVNRNQQTPPEGSVEFLQFMRQSGLRFRSLTEHPDAVSDTAVAQLNTGDVPDLNTIAVLPPFPPTTPAEQEFWARRDRQQMARDIYVLLYTIGGAKIDDAAVANTILDYTGSNSDRTGAASGATLYTEGQLRRMAQFAVNVVDALDTDNVITRFEYDKNLGDGWNLDDDPWTDNDTATSAASTVPPSPDDVTKNGMYPEDSGDRGVVYGVEAQQLAISEILAVRSPAFPGTLATPQDPRTLHANDTDPTYFLHVELQNMLPTTVDLASPETGHVDPNRAIWRLGRIDRETAVDETQALPTETIALMEGNDPIQGGGLFTIAVAGRENDPGNGDPTGWGTSDLYADITPTAPSGQYTLISPDLSETPIAVGTPNPESNLDLMHMDHFSPQRAIVTDDTSKRGGYFLQELKDYFGNEDFDINVGGASTPGFELVLQRRMNPNLPRLSVAENPWISVDRSLVDFRHSMYDFEDDGTGTIVARLKLDRLASNERAEPLAATTLATHDRAGDVAPQQYDEDEDGTADEYFRRNTIGSEINSTTNTAFNLFQAHFDRDFANMGELLNLFVVGPELLTAKFAKSGESPQTQIFQGGPPDAENIVTAAAMFLWPNFDPGTPSIDEASSAEDNRWYRFFQFAEVPSRVHRMMGNYITQNRVPGKMNLNMFRHQEVYAGLLDSPVFADQGSQNRLAAPFLDNDPAVEGGGGRDRWHEYLQERDGETITGFEPRGGTPGQRQYTIPGSPTAQPFRSLGFTQPLQSFGGAITDENANDVGLDRTVLRRLAQDRDAAQQQLDIDSTVLPENRNWLEIGDGAYHTTSASTMNRYQLLSKVLNNATTVSNTFIVYATAGYFEAVETPNGLIQVGGRIDLDNPSDDGDSSVDTGEDHTSGWQKKSVFIIDRTEFLNAYDSGTGSFDWKRLIKARVDVE